MNINMIQCYILLSINPKVLAVHIYVTQWAKPATILGLLFVTPACNHISCLENPSIAPCMQIPYGFNLSYLSHILNTCKTIKQRHTITGYLTGRLTTIINKHFLI